MSIRLSSPLASSFPANALPTTTGPAAPRPARSSRFKRQLSWVAALLFLYTVSSRLLSRHAVQLQSTSILPDGLHPLAPYSLAASRKWFSDAGHDLAVPAPQVRLQSGRWNWKGKVTSTGNGESLEAFLEKRFPLKSPDPPHLWYAFILWLWNLSSVLI